MASTRHVTLFHWWIDFASKINNWLKLDCWYAFVFHSIFSYKKSSYLDLPRVVLISRICQSLVLSSLSTLEAQRLNIKITPMWFQHGITVHRRLFWVISSTFWRNSSNLSRVSSFITGLGLISISMSVIFCRTWMELSLWFMECGLHTYWALLGKFRWTDCI